MCLAVPGRVISIDDSDALLRPGRVSFGGTIREVSLAMVPEAAVGDYVLVHAGLAISVVDADEAARIFEDVRQLIELENGKQ